MNLGTFTHLQNPAVHSTTAPKEIGYIDRISGLRSGLDELVTRLNQLRAKIVGTPTDPAPRASPPTQPGLPSQLMEAEDRLRECMAILAELDSKF